MSTLTVAAFVMGSSLVLLLSLLLAERKSRLDTRLDELPGPSGRPPNQDTLEKLGKTALPKMGAPLVPNNETARQRLKARLVQAGLYKRHSMVSFLGVKMLMMVSPALLGFALGSLGVLPLRQAVIWGALAGIFGTIAPSFWLDRQKAKRQSQIRRSLPDALDVIVVCLEGGLSLPAAFAKVGSELRGAHPLLAAEMRIMEREIQMGRSTGGALRQFADRFDVEEIRGLASVVLQAERFGASVSRTLRIHADALRLKRQQRAEELAHKAGTKMLFPTVLFIFPVMFIVLLGPAVFQILEVFSNLTIR